MKTILINIFLIFSFINLNATVYETVADGPWNNPTIWTPSQPNPNWSNTSDVYIIKHDVNLSNDLNLHGQALIVESGASLSNNGSHHILLTSGSVLLVDGDIDIKSVRITYGNPSVEVNGSLSVDELKFESGVLENTGTINIDGYFKNFGDLTNSGSIIISSYLENAYTNGEIDNSGYILIGSYLLNNNDIVNSGTIEVEDDFINNYNNDVENSGNIAVGGDFDNRGDLDNNNTITVVGSFENDWGSELSNTGVLSVTEDFTNKGDVTNTNYLNVDGDFTSDWGTSVTNYGVMEVEEDLSNNGNFVNDGDLTVDGTADSPGGAITGAGTLCSTAGTDPSGTGTIDNDICGGDDVGLPVELLEFEASFINDIVVLNWVTASELNNDYFEIQYSENAEDFKSVNRIQGAGNSNQIIKYNAEIDDNFQSGVYYFRLKQVDFDGSTSFSEINSVEVNDNLLNARIYPTPAKSMEEINIEFDEIIEVQIELYSLNGKLLYQDIKITNNYSFNSLNLDNSNYIIRIRSDQKTFVGKIHIIP